MPRLGRSFRRGRREAEDSDFLDGAFAFEGLAGTAIALVAIAIAAVVVVVLLPLIGVALELILLGLLFTSGLIGRVVLRRPWTVEAIDLDNGTRSLAFAVKGFGAAGRAATDLAEAIRASGPPEQLNSGTRTVLARPSF
jgi:hypothetical protein